MVGDQPAEVFARLCLKGAIEEGDELWEDACAEGVMDDVEVLAAARGESVVATEHGFYLVADEGSPYLLRPSDVMRGNGSDDRYLRATLSLVVLVVFDRLFDPRYPAGEGRIEFLERERVMEWVSERASLIEGNAACSDGVRDAARVWLSRPESRGEDVDRSLSGGNATSREGLVNYAFSYLVRAGLMLERDGGIWKPTRRLVALWSQTATLPNFNTQMVRFGIRDGG